jgi:hypothetical protein
MGALERGARAFPDEWPLQHEIRELCAGGS